MQDNGEEAQLPKPKDQATIHAARAFKILGIDRTTGYKAIREGRFPVPVLRVGRVILGPTASLARFLQVEQPPTSEGEER